MKILLVNKLYHPWIGGIETVTKDLAEGLRGQGFETEVLACVPRGSASDETIGGVPVHKAGSFGIFLSMPLSFDFFGKFRRLSRAADVIFLQHPFPLATLAHLLFARKKTVVVWYHADIERQKIANVFFAPLLRRSLARAARILVASRNLIVHSPHLRPFRSRCAVIPFGIDLARFNETDAIRKAAESVRAKFGAPLALAVGRLVPYKGYEYLIRAMKGVAAKLLIVGGGPLEAELKKIAADEGVASQISFVDHVDDPVPYFFACDFFALPSIYKTEAFGIVQLEAMACGKPVVNTDIPTGVPEVSIGGETGYTVPPRDVAALHGAIDALANDAAERERLGKAARTRAQDVFSMERFLKDVTEALRSLAA